MPGRRVARPSTGPVVVPAARADRQAAGSAPRGGELDRQRQTVEARTIAAMAGGRLDGESEIGPGGAGPLDEQGYGGGRGRGRRGEKEGREASMGRPAVLLPPNPP